jgi:hypothetical protein
LKLHENISTLMIFFMVTLISVFGIIIPIYIINVLINSIKFIYKKLTKYYKNN